MKAVLASIRPRHCIDIANDKKSLEVRKTCPKLDTPFKVYIYCTAGRPYMVYNDDPWCAGYTALNNLSEKRAKKIWELMNGKVIGEFVCDYIFAIEPQWTVHDEIPESPIEIWLEWDDAPEEYKTTEDISKAACLMWHEIEQYIGGFGCVYCWHISNLKIYDDPKPISTFCVSGNCEICPWTNGDIYTDDTHCKVDDGKKPLFRPPQSWCYVEESERR